MSTEPAEFDAYYVYLGIPPRDQPPNHYRLLGLELFESDLNIIEMAADRQMGHLTRHESGDHVEQVANLMSEVSRARLCLLDLKKKTAYDQTLSELHAPPTAKPAPGIESAGPPVSERRTQLDPLAAAQSRRHAQTSADVHLTSTQPLARPAPQLDQTTDTWLGLHRWQIVLGLGAGVAGLTLVAIVVAIMLGGKPDADSQAVVERSVDDATPADNVTPNNDTANNQETQDIVEKDVKPTSMGDVRIEPEVPTEGDDVQIWLPKEKRLAAKVDYRVDPLKPWQSIKQLTSIDALGSPIRENGFARAPFARPDRQADAPTLTLPKIQAGELRLEIRELDPEGNASEPIFKQIVVRENPWLKWKPAESIKHSQAIQRVRFNQDGKLLAVRAGSEASSTRVTQVAEQTVQFTWWNLADVTLHSETSTVDTLAAAVRDDGTLLMIQQTGASSRVAAPDAIDGGYGEEQAVIVQYTLYALSENRKLLLYEGSHPATAAALSPSGRFVAISFGGDVEVAKIPEGLLPTNLEVPIRHRGVAVAPADALSSGQYVPVVPTGPLAPGASPFGTGEGPYDPSQGVDPRTRESERFEFAPDESLLFVVKNELEVWQVAQQRRLRDLKVQANCIAVSNDGKHLAIGTGGVIQIWKFPEEQLVRTIDVGESRGVGGGVSSGGFGYGSPTAARTSEVTHLSFHPQADDLAAVVNNQVVVYQIANGRRLNTSVRHGGMISDLSFSPDGTILATGGADGIVQLWQNSDRRQPKSISAPVHKPALLVRIDSLVNERKYGPALDAMQLPVTLPKVSVATEDLLGDLVSGAGDLLEDIYGSEDEILLGQPSSRRRRPSRGRLSLPGEFEGMEGMFVGPGGYGVGVGATLTFTQMIADQQFKLLHKTLSDVKVPRLQPEVRSRFVNIQTRIGEEHKKLADEAMKAAVAKRGAEQEQANFLIYKNFPSELLPKIFTADQQRLQENRKQQADANWKRAVQSHSRGGRLQARNYLLKVIALKPFLPEEAARAENTLQQYKLRN